MKTRLESIRLALDVPLSTFTIVAAPPEHISQRTVEANCGIPARIFLEDVGSSGYEGEVIRRGKLRIVRRDEYVAWLRRRSDEQRRARDWVVADGADAVLAEVGLRVVAGAGR